MSLLKDAINKIPGVSIGDDFKKGIVENYPVLRITELEGNKRTLILTDRALPLKGVVFGGVEAKTEIIKYPGSRRRVIQRAGFQDIPTTFTFNWKTKFLNPGKIPEVGFPDISLSSAVNAIGGALMGGGDDKADTGKQHPASINGNKIVTVAHLVGIFTDFARSERFLEVQWGTIVRRGIIRRTTPPYSDEDSVRFQVEFDWTEDGLYQSLPRVKIENPADTSMLGDLKDALNLITKPAQIAKHVIDNVNDDINNVNAGILAIENAANAYINIPGQAAGAIKNMLATSGAIKASTSRLGTRAKASGAAVTSIGNDPFERANNRDFEKQVSDLSRQIAAASRKKEEILRKELRPEAIASFRLPENVDLRRVAKVYYDDSDLWPQLASYNELDTDRPVAGTEITVPKRAVLENI